MKDIRQRLVKALHTSSTLPQLREELVLAVCDMASVEDAAPTVRSPVTGANVRHDDAPDTEPDSAPPTMRNSEAGQEYGV